MRRCVTVGIRAATPAAGRSGSGPPPSSRLLPWLWQLLLSIGVRRLGGTVGRRRHRSPVSGSHTGGTPVAVVRHPRCPTRRCRRHRRSLPLRRACSPAAARSGSAGSPSKLLTLAIPASPFSLGSHGSLTTWSFNAVVQIAKFDTPRPSYSECSRTASTAGWARNRTPAPRPAGPPRHAPAPR